jgi:hypothetical protein
MDNFACLLAHSFDKSVGIMGNYTLFIDGIAARYPFFGAEEDPPPHFVSARKTVVSDRQVPRFSGLGCVGCEHFRPVVPRGVNGSGRRGRWPCRACARRSQTTRLLRGIWKRDAAFAASGVNEHALAGPE